MTMVPFAPPRLDHVTDGAPWSLTPEEVLISREGSVPTFSGVVVTLKFMVDELVEEDWTAMRYFLLGSFLGKKECSLG